MAGGKLTPRQKMINMMYLVLTALLAMNVSKEILDSFVTVNNGLETTKRTLSEKMDETYTTFSSYAQQNQEKYGAAYKSAQQIQTMAKDLIAMIDRTKAEVISKTEGKPLEQVFANDTVINLKYIDPSYTIRSLPANTYDSAYGLLLGYNAVHAAMSGRTNMVVGYWNNEYTHVPIPLAVYRRKTINPQARLWNNVLLATGQRLASPA